MQQKHINLTDEIKVQYCIPVWLRDEQIKVNIKKVKGRVEPSYDFIDDPIAVVNFGPSLKDTYEEIHKFKHVISCSGAHKFLLDNGFKPSDFKWWGHLDVDPREHKIKLLGIPQKGIIYLPASAVHPKYMDWLQQHDVDIHMWHIFANQDESLRILPPGEWAILGGSSVGLRTMTMARFLGYRDLHIFGMDGNFKDDVSHAADHPNAPKGYVTTEVNGRVFKTTPSMLAVAKETWHELDEMPDVTAVFYGDGIVQEMSKSYERKPPTTGLIGMQRPILISDEYKEMQRKFHEDTLHYGVGAGSYADIVTKLKDSVKAQSVLDYGCGKGYLAKSLDFPIWEYDPCVPNKDETPRAADLVVAIDVLEHIEPQHLDAVMLDLVRCTKKCGYFVIHTKAAEKVLPDGRNTHLIQEDVEWWDKKLRTFFHLEPNSIKEVGDHLHVIVAPKRNIKLPKYEKIRAI